MTVANPYSAGPIVTDAEMFFGREEELRRIRDRLRKGGSMAVIGLRRIGKSSLLYQLAHQADQLPEGAVAAYLEAPEVGLIPAPLVEQGILSPFRHATGGTLLAARKALDHGIGINLGGGYHHAKPSAGEGFCIYADMPIAIRETSASIGFPLRHGHARRGYGSCFFLSVAVTSFRHHNG